MTLSNINFNEKKFNEELPSSALAEKLVLSSFLKTNNVLDKCRDTLKPEVFYFTNHQCIYEAMCLLSQDNQPIDAFILTNYLQSQGFLEKAGGIGVLLELSEQIVNLNYVDQYIQLLREKYNRRLFIKLGYNLISSGFTTNKPLNQVLYETEADLLDINNQFIEQEQKFYNAAELSNLTFLNLRKKADPNHPNFIPLTSGFKELDEIIQGFQPSDLIVLSGRPSTGKTALSLNVILHVLKKKKIPIVFFSLEMSKEQIFSRLLTIETRISQNAFKSGHLSGTDWTKVGKLLKILAKLPLFINDDANLSVEEMRSILKKIAFEQDSIGLVIVDYLQLLKILSLKTTNRTQEISEITRALKIIAREFKVPIIILSQLSRQLENRPDRTPKLSDLRDSGSIEQDADLVLMISSLSSYKEPNKTEIIVAKQRNGPTGSILLNFKKAQLRFVKYEKE